VSERPEGTFNSDNPLVQQPGYHTSAAQQSAMLKPTGITVAGVISLMAGLFGLLAGVLLIAQLIFAQQFSDAFLPTGPEAQPQRDMNAAMAAINFKYMIPHVMSSLAGLGISACLAIGGVGCLLGKPWAPRWMLKTLLALLIYEILRTIFLVVLQFETVPVIQEHMERIAETGAAGGGASAEMMQSIQEVSMIVGFVFWGAWFLTKCGLALWGRSYFKREHVLAFFREPNKAPS
jgi:hypothetical protein